MSRMFSSIAKAGQTSLMALALILTSGCAGHADDEVRTRFLWGPVERDLTPGMGTPTPSFDDQSRASRLREELLAPVNRYAPSDKDWRYVRGTDKGPTIFGARLSFKMEGGGTELRVGAVKRGANRTYGPQFIFGFGGDK